MSTADHLTAEMVEGYKSRRLAPNQLLVATQHLADCEECQLRVVPQGGQAKLIEALGSEHLNYESLEAIVHGSREGLDHIAECPMCADELRDLRTFRTDFRKPARGWNGMRVLVPATGLALAAIALTVVFLHRAPGPPPVVGSTSGDNAAQPVPVAALRDGGRLISLSRAGTLSGIDGVSTEDAGAIAEALRAGRIPFSAAGPDLVRSRETLLGATSDSAVLQPLAPVGTSVISDTPVFHWQGPKNAHRFRVAVYDQDFILVAASPVLEGTVWSSEKPLPRGKIFSWTVSAVIAGVPVTGPHSPEPEARFRVATTAEYAQIDAARKTIPVSDLRVAVAAARLGLREESVEAADRLAAQNPGSALAAHLRASLNPTPK